MGKGYMTAVERAPLLKATALEEDYKLLAEFNGAVLAGREPEHGYVRHLKAKLRRHQRNLRRVLSGIEPSYKTVEDRRK
jgi:hypothetical protein